MSSPRPSNPFRIHGIVDGDFYTDRETELTLFTRALREPTSKHVVSGPRRTGKTSTLERAVAEINATGGYAIIADLSTATTIADMANRILKAATKTMGKRWRDYINDLARLLKADIKLQYDPASQAMVPSLEIGARGESVVAQQDGLASVLDTLNEMAAARDVTLGVVLDEFQEITRFGTNVQAGSTTKRLGRGRGAATVASRDQQPEWRLRGAMQKHTHLSYILAGSRQSLLDAMTAPDAAFYKMLTPVSFRPIDAHHMAHWIDERLESVGLRSENAGADCVQWAGPRTRDIVRLARKAVDRATDERVIDAAAVTEALREIVEEEHDGFQMRWSNLTAIQQNVLRAVAATGEGLTSDRVRRAFSLRASGTVSNALSAFLDEGFLVKTAHGAGYTFDDPYMRAWVIHTVLTDVGVTLPITHVANPTSEYD